MEYKVFTEENKRYLIAHYKTMTYSEIGDILGFNAERIGRQVAKLGLRKAEDLYTEEQDDFIF